MGQIDFNILRNADLLVVGDSISIRTEAVIYGEVDDMLSQFESDVQAVRDMLPATTSDDPAVARLLVQFYDSIAGLTANRSSESVGMGGGKLHKSLHKSLHKTLHKSLHKTTGLGTGAAQQTGDTVMSWPVIEVPWRELNVLYAQRDSFGWHRLLAPPPPVAERLDEIPEILTLQRQLREPDNAFRRQRIRIEATNDLTAYMLPLGADVTTPGSRTAVMFQVRQRR